MIIFLEGPDGGGKSNLAKRLAKQYMFKQASFSYPRNEHEKKAMVQMYKEFIYNNHNVIVDRCWYSEMVYGPIIRKEHNVSKKHMYELEQFVLDNGGGMVIHCTDKLPRLWKRFSERGDDYIAQDFNLISRIKREYEHLFHVIPHLITVVRYEINENMPKL